MYRPPRPMIAALALALSLSLAACGEEDPNANQDTNQDQNQTTNQGDNQTTNQTNNETTNQTTNQSGDQWDPDFVAVADVIRTSCAVGDCHGANSNPNTVLEFGASGDNLANEDIQNVFENFEVDVPLVDPGNPEGSQIYQYITSDDDNVRMPPPPLVLSQDDIDTIESWIADGANYEAP